MGRHSAPRRHGPVVVLGAAAVVGSAGLAWAVGGDPEPQTRPPVRSPAPAATTAGPEAPFRVAPTPSRTPTATPVVLGVPQTSPTPQDLQPVPAPSTTPTSDASTAVAPAPEPTRTKPGKGVVPTPRPTKPPK